MRSPLTLEAKEIFSEHSTEGLSIPNWNIRNWQAAVNQRSHLKTKVALRDLQELLHPAVIARRQTQISYPKKIDCHYKNFERAGESGNSERETKQTYSAKQDERGTDSDHKPGLHIYGDLRTSRPGHLKEVGFGS